MLGKCALVAIFYTLICQSLVSLADDEKVVSYNAETFNEAISNSNHFVMFYAPWCGHCKRLHPTWEQLAETQSESAEGEDRVIIAKVDCTVEAAICSEHDVTGYPTLKFFKLTKSESVKFRGTRDLSSLIAFINEQLDRSSQTAETESIAEPFAVRGLTELTEINFRTATTRGNHFVKFYAPWCGHCQKLAPIWEQLAEKFESNDDLRVAKVDCTQHRTVCNSLEIKGYPTLLFIKDGAVAEKYTGQRTLDDLTRFVKRTIGDESPPPTVIQPNAVPLLNAQSFSTGVSSGLTFVKFFAPWCGYCKRLAPTWSELSQKVKDQAVRLARVDCTQPDSKDLCNEQEVFGFPTLILYRDGVITAEYHGSRDVDDMYQFLSKYFYRDEL